MTLRDWLHARGVKQNEFARRISRRIGRAVPLGTVNRWAKRPDDPLYTIPQPALVQAIRAETDGAVDANAWYPLDVLLPLHKPRGRTSLQAAE